MKMAESVTFRGQTYLTGNGLRARWQRFRLWRAYRRPVTYADLRKIAHATCFDAGDYHNPDKTGLAMLDHVIKSAEIRVISNNHE
ncbi:hypothetical protein JQX09_15680 [Sulfitobacter pseudonitzschiae]|uniref:Uncharacterized protein n=1 Tax=Pseudosulfitobacter pseudonitzschiae TaxID=1402135 RepID=A0A9Q2NSA2_9RHOB|nr:hypothetical protein [Pseudosulfitobacter pseudonitzschiae]MBM2293470.1 hypothetical protein [Pseudosulfitobacter pseudonitzschiae]MBM2298284.1 hypothetical protein [Pseudosulfitobacter pseudonitzschiae]MBM2303197.1 hypothetical protein [Pseudosulfitobacter pseudonitzschiae]MBM2312981.1 hypothetical protein [Pseudosulfitobacter pseudonitzschiae]MBM2317894.1 hypothetical protein [Pseudosulfitobacter pseudonitzschiae]